MGDQTDKMADKMQRHSPGRPVIASVLALGILALGASGCADSAVLDMVGGGAGLPPEGAEQGLIQRATDEDKTWPNLATVPPRPSAFTKPAERQALMDRLKVERADSDVAREELDTRAPVPSAVAPPRQAPPSIPPMGGAVPPPVGAIHIPQTPPSTP
jgi:hypothetical protein